MKTGNHAEEDDGGAQLSYGRGADGRLLHVAEVPSGLACGCTCPGCGARLVARKGQEKVHHFAHHVTAACRAAWETTLHLLAKEALVASREILLPEVVAEVRDLREDLFPATVFHFDTAEDEVVMAAGDGEGRTIIPDTLVRRGDRLLLVEFAVTHFCPPEKVAELRRRGLATVEVDLSGIPRHASREEHLRQISEAPRRWLFNARLDEAEARLHAEARRRAERRHAGEARAIRAALSAPLKKEDADLRSLQRAADAGLGEVIGLPVEGKGWFKVEDAQWQAAILDALILRSPWERWSGEGLLRQMDAGDLVKRRFAGWAKWDAGLLAYLSDDIPAFRAPWEVVADYCAQLATQGLVTHDQGAWRAVPEIAAEARERLERAQAYRSRAAEIRQLVGMALVRARRRRSVNPEAWLQRDIMEFGGTPAAIAAAGGPAFDALKTRLRQLVAMTRQGGEALPPEQHLGLPLEPEAAARVAERRAYEAAVREMEEATAAAHFRREAGFRDPDQLARLWLRGRQQALGACPWDHATDRDRLARCLALLNPAKKGRR